jgi:phosphinothricin acetyltransferase
MNGDSYQNEALNITFEPIKEEHIPAALEIYKYYVENSTATFHTHVPSIEEFKGLVFFENERNRAFIIRQEGHVCGYVILGQHSKREAYIDTGSITIYLSSACLSKGIGSAAIRFIEQYAKEKGFHVLVSTVCGENVNSIRLFERSGYTKCGHYRELGKKFGRLLDIIAFQKILD